MPRAVRALTGTSTAVLGALLLAGTFVTAAGPHSGDADTPRLAAGVPAMAQLHADLLFGYLGLLVGLGFALRAVAAPAGLLRRYAVLVAAVLLQGVVGGVQYALGVPEALASLHVLGAALVTVAAAAVWTGTAPRGPVESPPTPPRPGDATPAEPPRRAARRRRTSRTGRPSPNGADMRAVQMTATGGPDVLVPADLPDPRPGPGELLVDVAVAGVNYIDTYHRRGVYPVDLPLVPGQEGAGRVAALGGGDTGGFAVGDRVVWANIPGGYAERVVVPVEAAVAIPDAIPDDVAVGAYLQGMTAHFLVSDCAPVGPGDTVLVHAAAGGVGLLLTQLATARGARVLGTVSTAGKAELVRSRGGRGGAPVGRRPGRAGPRPDRRDRGRRGVRRRRPRHLRREPGQPAPPRHARALRGRQRTGAAGRPAAAQPGRLGVPHAPDAAPLRRDPRGAHRPRRGRVRRGRRREPAGPDRAPLPARARRRAHDDLEGRRTTGKVLLVP